MITSLILYNYNYHDADNWYMLMIIHIILYTCNYDNYM